MGTNNRPSRPADRAQADLRKTARYGLEVPVTFSWVDECGVRQMGEGRSRDISASGVFVVASSCPSPGATVGLSILLSPDPQPERVLQMQAEARVLRVEQAGQAEETIGFAATNQKVVVLRGNEVVDQWTPPTTTERERELRRRALRRLVKELQTVGRKVS